jgi:hypothetical protein
MLSFFFISLILTLVSSATAFPTYGSLAGLPRSELDKILPTLQFREPASPPPPLKFNGTKLVNDAQHPWMPLRQGDIRGPCPGLNTLASHGVGIFTDVWLLHYLNRPIDSISLAMGFLRQHKSSPRYKKVLPAISIVKVNITEP